MYNPPRKRPCCKRKKPAHCAGLGIVNPVVGKITRYASAGSVKTKESANANPTGNPSPYRLLGCDRLPLQPVANVAKHFFLYAKKAVWGMGATLLTPITSTL